MDDRRSGPRVQTAASDRSEKPDGVVDLGRTRKPSPPVERVSGRPGVVPVARRAGGGFSSARRSMSSTRWVHDGGALRVRNVGPIAGICHNPHSRRVRGRTPYSPLPAPSRDPELSRSSLDKSLADRDQTPDQGVEWGTGPYAGGLWTSGPPLALVLQRGLAHFGLCLVHCGSSCRVHTPVTLSDRAPVRVGM